MSDIGRRFFAVSAADFLNKETLVRLCLPFLWVSGMSLECKLLGRNSEHINIEIIRWS